MSEFSRDSLQLVSPGLDPRGQQQYRQGGGCRMQCETQDTLHLKSDVPSRPACTGTFHSNATSYSLMH